MRQEVVGAKGGKQGTSPADSASSPPQRSNNQSSDASLCSPSSLPRNTVFLNVYDIVEMNYLLYPLGIGAHHTGVEVYNTEVAFGRTTGGTGVYETTPKVTPPHIFREQIVLGQTPLALDEVYKLIEEFKSNSREWSGLSYHLIQRNCNDFSEAFARSLIPPDLRAVQRGQISCLYDCGEVEDVRLSSGAVVKLPVLFPMWTNRLARSAARWLPTSIIEKLEEVDKRNQET